MRAWLITLAVIIAVLGVAYAINAIAEKIKFKKYIKGIMEEHNGLEI